MSAPVLAVLLGAAAAVLFRVEIPVLAPEWPFRLGSIPLLLAFALLGGRWGALAGAVVVAAAAPGGGTALLADGLHVAEAWSAALLFARVRSLAFAVVLFWCTAGLAADLLGFGLILRTPASALLLLFAAQLFAGVLGAFVAEALLGPLARWVDPARLPARTQLRHYFFRWAMWLVVAPGLLLTLVFGYITYREQMATAQADVQRTLWQAAADVTAALDARGRALEDLAAGIELAMAGGAPPGGPHLDRVRAADSTYVRLLLRDAGGRVLASSPQFVGAAAEAALPAAGAHYAVAAERADSAAGAAPLRLAVGLTGPDGGPAGTLAGTLDARFLAGVLARQTRRAGDVLRLEAEDGTLLALAGPDGGRTGAEAGPHAARHPIAPLRGWLEMERPLAEVQRGGRNAVARLLGSFLAITALLQLATSVLARKVAAPLARMDGAAGALETGSPGGAALLEDLAGSPIAEVHGLATRFAGMHEALAHHDGLTGLPNERLLLDRLSVSAAQAAEPPSSFTLLLVDLDRFRVIDSTLGHAMANEVLQKVARRLQDSVRVGDTVARVGGDEFALLLPRVGRMEDATDAALKVMDAIKRPFLVAGQDVFVTASVGICLFPRDGPDPESLLKNAVAAAYAAKEQGQDSVRQYTARIKVRDAQRLLIETGLRRALEHGGLFLLYQPIVDLRTGQVLAAEALVRWRREDVGVMEAGAFIPVAEASGLITAIDQWVVRTACVEAARWRDAGHALKVAVNLSARQMHEPDLVEQVRHALDRSSLEARLLEIEVTEGVALRDVERSAEVLHEIRRLGVSISVDDFGTGYSSLSFLRRLPVDRVKLDRSFVQDVTRNADDAAIATAVIAMSHGLRLGVVAEGVENEEQLEFLRRHDCDAMQGRLFSPPVEGEELLRLASQGPRRPSGEAPATS